MKTAVATSLLVLAGLAVQPEGSERLRFRINRFSIKPLEGQSASAVHQPLIMMLPPSQCFAPNVNVQIQPYRGSLDDYMVLSKSQFKAAKWTLVKEQKLGEDTVVFEFFGAAQGRPLHWFARAQKRGAKVYLATATATLAQWPKLSRKLIACVTSFKLEAGQPGAAADADKPRR